MDSSTLKKRHTPILIAQKTKSVEKTHLYHFKSKLLFENLMHISPQDIEEALNINDPNLKLPSFLELLDLKIRIQTEEQKLKNILPHVIFLLYFEILIFFIIYFEFHLNFPLIFL